MGLEYGEWTKKNREAIEATSAIISGIGIVVVAAGLWVSVMSLKVASSALEESKKATTAQTFFNIQRFGYNVAKDTTADPSFESYIREGIGPEKKMLGKFATLLAAYNIIHFQRKLGYIKDPEWDLFKREFCRMMLTKGADDYFRQNPIEKSMFDDDFKKLTISCRCSQLGDAHATTL